MSSIGRQNGRQTSTSQLAGAFLSSTAVSAERNGKKRILKVARQNSSQKSDVQQGKRGLKVEEFWGIIEGTLGDITRQSNHSMHYFEDTYLQVNISTEL